MTNIFPRIKYVLNINTIILFLIWLWLIQHTDRTEIFKVMGGIVEFACTNLANSTQGLLMNAMCQFKTAPPPTQDFHVQWFNKEQPYE